MKVTFVVFLLLILGGTLVYLLSKSLNVGVYFDFHLPTYTPSSETAAPIDHVVKLGSTLHCKEAIPFRIGYIDGRYTLTKDELKNYATIAAANWTAAYGKPLFVYDESADLSINLVWSEREGALQALRDLSEKYGPNPEDSFAIGELQSNEDFLKNSLANEGEAANYKEIREGDLVIEAALDVNFFYSAGQLTNSLTHGLGHALGIIDIPFSSYMMSVENFTIEGLPRGDRRIITAQDLDALKKVCNK